MGEQPGDHLTLEEVLRHLQTFGQQASRNVVAARAVGDLVSSVRSEGEREAYDRAAILVRTYLHAERRRGRADPE